MVVMFVKTRRIQISSWSELRTVIIFESVPVSDLKIFSILVLVSVFKIFIIWVLVVLVLVLVLILAPKGQKGIILMGNFNFYAHRTVLKPPIGYQPTTVGNRKSWNSNQKSKLINTSKSESAQQPAARVNKRVGCVGRSWESERTQKITKRSPKKW